MTEIFGTLGPACAQTDLIEQMFSEGMTGMRLNLSHGGLKKSEPLIHSFWLAAQRAGVHAELLIDMQGPEIRIGELTVPLSLKEQQQAVFTAEHTAEPGDSVIPVAAHIFSALEAGSHVLLDDGKIELVVEEKGKQARAKVLRGGTLCARKSLKIAGRQIPAPVMTAQDLENIHLAGDYGVTALMQPFVTEKEQLIAVKNELWKNGMERLRIFAKIENRAGIEHVCDFMPYADMIVIARGDLGNDMPLWELPAAQKELSDLCRSAGKPFLVVTELLASMTQHPYPTRAEVSDIFHAVLDGAAAVMVTNETAVGKYPAEVIRYLQKTVKEAENCRKKAGILASPHR